MEKYIDMTVCGTKTGLKEVLKESGLKIRLGGDFSKGQVWVSVKQIQPTYSDIFNTYSLGISSKNIKAAANLCNLILENKYRRIFGIKSNLCTDEMLFNTGTGGFS